MFQKLNREDVVCKCFHLWTNRKLTTNSLTLCFPFLNIIFCNLKGKLQLCGRFTCVKAANTHTERKHLEKPQRQKVKE